MSQHASKPLDTLYYPREAAEFLKVDEGTLSKWRSTGMGPRYIKVSARAIRYEESELQRFKAERTRQSTWDAIDSAVAATAPDDSKKKALRTMVKEVIRELMGPDGEEATEEADGETDS
jgi:predicted site-specific integrase-resolvase